jgi:hypothetical protein
LLPANPAAYVDWTDFLFCEALNTDYVPEEELLAGDTGAS